MQILVKCFYIFAANECCDLIPFLDHRIPMWDKYFSISVD